MQGGGVTAGRVCINHQTALQGVERYKKYMGPHKSAERRQETANWIIAGCRVQGVGYRVQGSPAAHGDAKIQLFFTQARFEPK